MNKERARLSSGAKDEHSPGIQERKGQDFFFFFAALGLSCRILVACGIFRCDMWILQLWYVDSTTVAHGLSSCGAQA